MAQTIEGGRKTSKTIEAKYGKNYWKEIGSKGGKAKNPNKGFGSKTPEERKAAGAKGGRISRRPSKAIKFEKTGDTERVYDTSNLGVDSNSVSNSGGVLRRTLNRVLK